MQLLELSPSLREIFSSLGGKAEEEAIKVLTTGLKELLRECEKDILEFEIKYGMPFERFKEDLEQGRLGEPHSYPVEKDAMVWEDLIKEKHFRLEAIRKIEGLG